VIFEGIDPVWLRMMWEDGGSARANMIDFDLTSSVEA
jgi:hypothetical protein